MVGGCLESAFDGIFCSYSVNDSARQVSVWADRTFMIPMKARPSPWLGQLLTSSAPGLVGIREPAGVGWSGS